MSMWSTASGDYGMTSGEADRCSDPPEESCSDAGCPVHGDCTAAEMAADAAAHNQRMEDRDRASRAYAMEPGWE